MTDPVNAARDNTAVGTWQLTEAQANALRQCSHLAVKLWLLLLWLERAPRSATELARIHGAKTPVSRIAEAVAELEAAGLVECVWRVVNRRRMLTSVAPLGSGLISTECQIDTHRVSNREIWYPVSINLNPTECQTPLNPTECQFDTHQISKWNSPDIKLNPTEYQNAVKIKVVDGGLNIDPDQGSNLSGINPPPQRCTPGDIASAHALVAGTIERLCLSQVIRVEGRLEAEASRLFDRLPEQLSVEQLERCTSAACTLIERQHALGLYEVGQ